VRVVNILFNFKKSINQKKILGVERCFIDYSKGLKDLGNEIIAITKPNMIFSDEIRENKVKCHEVKAVSIIDIFSIIHLAFIFRSFKPDVLICHSGRAMTLSRYALKIIFKKIPIVAIDHGINPEKFVKADFVLPVNSYFAEQYIKNGKPRDRVMPIPNMIKVPENFKKLKKAKFRKKIRLGALGRLYPEKNFDKVILAIDLLRKKNIECDFVIGGVGPEQKKLENLATSLNLDNNFRILGWVEDKKKFFSDIDIFILPSFAETFGIVLLEAMLYSTPIITSNTWGPSEIIQNNKNGIKISKDNSARVPQLISNAILKLNNDQKFASNLAENAYLDFWNKYSSKKVLEKLNNILLKAINNCY